MKQESDYIAAHLIDVARSTTFTCLYLAEHIGGHPGEGMGWESQAAVLAPLGHLSVLLTSAYDAPIVAALVERLGGGGRVGGRGVGK